MKKMNRIFAACAALTLCSGMGMSVLAEEADVLRGDVSGDGVVDCGDASFVLQAYANQLLNYSYYDMEARNYQSSAADVNGDGVTDCDDAGAICKYYAWTMLYGVQEDSWDVVLPMADSLTYLGEELTWDEVFVIDDTVAELASEIAELTAESFE